LKIVRHIPHPALRHFIEAFVVVDVEENDIVKDFYPANSVLMCFDITQQHAQKIVRMKPPERYKPISM
jgi:hypothetical protein